MCDHDRVRPIAKHAFQSGLQVQECLDCGERLSGPHLASPSPLSYLSPAGLEKLRAKSPALFRKWDRARKQRAEVRAGIVEAMRVKASTNGKAK